MRERLLLIDSNSLIYRGYFAIPPLTTTKGELSNATFGFASILLKAIEELRPQYMAAAFDLPQKTWRHEADVTYKATRKPMPDELRPQFERCKEILERFGVPIYALPGYEADDVIGALARQAEVEGLEAVIVSGDLDPLQLVTPNVKLFTTRMGFQNTVVYDEAKIDERYGLKPSQMVDFKALKGDATDNIPGVPGVGEKTAAKLVAEHSDLEGVYADLTGYTPKLRESLAAHREQVFKSRMMATIVTDLPVKLETDRARWKGYDRAAVLELFRDLEFRSLIPRLPPADANLAATPQPAAARPGQLALGLDTPPATPPPVDTAVVDAAGAEQVAATVRGAGSLALHADVELRRHPDLVGVGIAIADRAWYVPATDGLPAPIAALLADASFPKTVHDAKTARRALRRAGAELRGVRMDTMLASYLVNASRRYHALEDLAAERLKVEVPVLPVPDRKDPNRMATTEERTARAGAGAIAAAQLGALFDEELDRLNMRRLFDEVELPLVDVLVEMEEAGIAVDVSYLRSLGEEFAREVARIEREAYDSVGHEFPINSPKQLASLLFEELRLPRGRRTATGYSTDATVLEELRGAHPVVDKILEYREIEKLRSTYAEGLGALIDPETKRVHTTFDQAVAATGRLSSKNPNLQNIPIRTALGRRIRRAFVASPGHALVAADYSQIELRVLAHVSGDPELTKAFREGADVHRRTAAAGFRVTEDEVTREQRDVAKMLNFGIAYGMSDFGLASRMKMSRDEAQRFIDEYFRRYVQLQRYVVETKAFAAEQGYVETLMGRRRYIADMTSPNRAIRSGAERMAVNMPIQGTAADIMKIAMRRVYDRLARSTLDARVLLQVHDELVAEVPIGEVDEVAAILCEEMSGAYHLDVPLVVDVRSGPNWDEMARMQVPAAA